MPPKRKFLTLVGRVKVIEATIRTEVLIRKNPGDQVHVFLSHSE